MYLAVITKKVVLFCDANCLLIVSIHLDLKNLELLEFIVFFGIFLPFEDVELSQEVGLK